MRKKSEEAPSPKHASVERGRLAGVGAVGHVVVGSRAPYSIINIS